MPRSKTNERSPPAPRATAARADGKGNTLQTRKRQMVREEIIRSAAKLFAERGVRGVSLDEVASELGYAKSSVYYYFESKDALLWAVFAYISDHFVGEAERIARSFAEPLERLQELVRMHVRFLAEHREWATVFYRDLAALPDDRQAQVRAIIVRYDSFFRQAVQDGAGRGAMQALAPDIVANAVLGACNWMVNWISAKHSHQIDEIAETYVRLFTTGLAMPRP